MSLLCLSNLVSEDYCYLSFGKKINKNVEVISACVILRYWIFHNWVEADKNKQIIIQGGPLHKNSGPMTSLTTRCLPPLHFQMLNIHLSIPTQIHPDAKLPTIHTNSPRVLEPLWEYWNTQNMCSNAEGMEEAERTIWGNSLLKLEPYAEIYPIIWQTLCPNIFPLHFQIMFISLCHVSWNFTKDFISLMSSIYKENWRVLELVFALVTGTHQGK